MPKPYVFKFYSYIETPPCMIVESVYIGLKFIKVHNGGNPFDRRGPIQMSVTHFGVSIDSYVYQERMDEFISAYKLAFKIHKRLADRHAVNPSPPTINMFPTTLTKLTEESIWL